MECGTCRHDNDDDAKFCSECGAPLTARCRTCESPQAPGAKFCNQCGTPMRGATAEPTPPAPPSAVRKQVTALFADLVGSTSFGEQVDPEAARAALAPYFEILRSTIEGHAGTVAKFTGDGVMAIFGVPEIAEDDALRAVAAGLELQRRFRAFGDSVRGQHGLELGLRVGINTGELVVGDGDADLVGDVLNTAARLEAACEPGRVMVGEDTWRLTRSSVSYEVLGEVTVKGKAEALATFQVVDDDRSATEDATPFVGRAAELAALRSAFDDTVASGTAKLVTVVGAPGVGKTRLAAELRAGVDVRSFDLRFERRGSTTFTPIVELLRELTRSASPEDVAALVADHAEAARLAGVLSSFLGHGATRSTEESFWAVRRLLEQLAATEPLLIVVDDIQWAESLFWDLLDHLVEWTDAPVLLVALARPELRELRPELTQAGRRVTAALAVEGLDADTTRELAARLLDTDELPGELIERIPDSTEGNPLFVRELVQMLVDDGTLAKDGGRWHLTIDADAIEVPPTVLSLLASRVERLPDDERQVVELASVIGTEFDRGLLAAIAGPDVSVRLGALIDRLRRKDLIEPSGTWAGDHPVYRFHHVLVRDAAYRRLLKGHRAELHERVGAYIDELGADGGESDVVVAFHYEQAHRYRSELGTLDDHTRDLARRAAGRLRAAAHQALERDDLTASGSFADRALALTDDHEQRSELLLLGCEALLSSGNVGRGGALVDAMDRAERRDDRFAAWADCFRAQLWSLTDADRLAESEALADAAADRLDALDDQSGVAKARLVRAACLARLGRVGDCEDELDLALGAARAAGDRRRTVAVLGAAPLAALWGPSPVARAGGRCLDVLRLLRITTASPAVEATSVRCQGMLEALRGRLDSARTKLEQSRATAREIGLRQGLFETELFAGLVELLDGDPVAAEPHLRAARDGLGRLGIGADAGQAAALLGRALLRQGRVDEADDLSGEALASAGQNLQTAIAARAVLAEVRSAQGRHDEASSLIAEAVGIAERTDVIVDHALVELAAIVVAEAADDQAAVRRHRERARQLLDAKGVTLELSGASTNRAATPSPAAPASTPTTDDADEITNAVVQLQHRVDAAILAGDRSAAMSLFADDLTTSDSGVIARSVAFEGRTGAGSWVDFLLDMLSLGTEHEITLEPIAVRGERLALARAVAQIDGGMIDRLVVVVSDGSVVTHYSFYDVDQVELAHDELVRRWNDEIGVASGPEERREPASDAHHRVDELATDRTGHSSGDLTNAAVSVVREVASELPRDRDVLAARVASHALHHERRDGRLAPGHGVRRGCAGVVDALLEVRPEEGSMSPDIDVVAIRGDDLCLVRLRAAPEAGVEHDTLSIFEVRDGVVQQQWFHDALALRRAQVELDRIWFDSIGLPADAPIRRLSATSYTTDPDELVTLMHPELEYREHRRISFEGGDLGMLAGNSRSLELIDHIVVTRIHRCEPRRAAFERWEVSADDTTMTRLIVVGALVDDRVRWVDIFDPDDLDAALARFEELGAHVDDGPAPHSKVLENRAWRLALAVERAFRTGDRGAALALVHEEFVGDHREPLRTDATLDREQWVDAMIHHHHLGDDVRHRGEVVAIRGDDLVLIRNTSSIDGDDISELLILQADGGRLINARFYEHDQLTEAHIDLDRRYLETLGIESGSLLWNMVPATYAVDGDTMAPFLGPEFQFVDHRPSSWPTMDRDEFVDAMSSYLDDDYVLLPEVFAVTERTVANERVEHSSGEYAVHMFVVTQLADGHVRRIEIYETRAEAMRRFEEIETGADAATSAVEEIRNAASDAMEEAPLLRSRGDVDDLRDRFHPDFVGRHRGRVFAAAGDMDRDEWIAVIGSVLDVGGRYETDVLAIRGDDLALSRVNFVVGDDVSERLVLTRLDGGLLRDSTVFEADDLHDALDELDRLDTESRGPTEFGDLLRRARHANVDGDRDAVRELLAPEFHIDDRRTLGIGDVGRDDYVRTSTRAGTTYLVREIVADTGRAALARSRWIAHDGSHWDQLDVVRYGGGRFEHIVLFDPDDVTTARSLFDELTGSVAAGGPTDVENEASRIARRVNDCFARGDRAGCETLIHGDAEVHTSMRFRTVDRTDRDGLLDQWFALFDREGTADTTTSRVIAVRGDTLCLLDIGLRLGDATNVGLALYRADGGRIAEIWFYEHDDVRVALDELHRQFEATFDPVPPSIVAARRFRAAMESNDRAAYRALLSDDLVSIDHRTLGMGARTADQQVDSAPKSASTMIGRQFVAFDDLRSLTLVEAKFDDGSDITMYILTVLDAESDLATHLEMFDEADREAALARFSELAGPHALGPTSTSHADDSAGPLDAFAVENEAVRALHRGMEGVRRGDWQAFEASLREDFVCHSFRRFRTGDEFDRDAFVGQWLALFETEGPPTTMTSTPIAVRGDTLCLTEDVGTFGDAEPAVSLNVHRIEDGLGVEVWCFDAEDLRLALDELDRQFDATFDSVPAASVTARRLRAAMEGGDPAAYRTLLSDELVSIDHRTLGMGVRTADEQAGSLPGGGITMIMRRAVAFDDLWGLSLTESRFEDGSDITMYILMGVDPESHLATHIEMFDETDGEAALARFHELTESGPDAGTAERSTASGARGAPSDDAAPPFTNDAFRIARRVDECFVRGDWSAARALVHHDAVGHSAMRFRTWDEFGPGDFVDAWRRLYETEGAPTRSSCTLVAIRGESLCLEDNTVEFDDAVIAALQLTRVVDGRVAECWFFERDDLHDALDELDRQWDGAGETRLFVDFHAVWRRSQASGDREAVAGLLSPEFRAFDERRLGLPPMNRGEYLATSVGPNPGTDVVIQQIYGVRNRAGLHRARITSSGGAMWEHVAAWRCDEHELLEEIHTFDVDDHAAARRRFEELATDADERPPAALSNEAVVVASRVHELYTTARRTREQRDRDALLSIVHPGYRGHDATRLRLADDFDRDQFLAAWLDGFEWAGTPTRHVTEPVAIRGEQLCLSRISLEYDQDLFERFLITRVEDGLVAESWWFEADALHDALDELDAQWVASGGHAAWAELGAQLRAANWSGDVELLERLTSADWVVHDRRTLGIGRMDRSQYVATSFGRRVRYIQTEIVEVTDRVGLTRDRFVDRDGAEWHQLAVVSYESGSMLGVELFDPDDLDGARARFDELAAVGRGGHALDGEATRSEVGDGAPAAAASTPTSPEPTNDAVVVARRGHELFGEMLAGERDGESLLSLTHPTYRGHTETRLRLDEDFDGDQFLAQWIEQFAWAGPPTRHDFVPIAVRGSTLCLARLALEYGDDHLHRLFVTRIEDGLIAEHWWFEPDALHDALDLLDELWAASGDGMLPIDAQLGSRYRRALATGTADDFRALVTDDYVMRDHRALGMGVRDCEEYLASSGELFGKSEIVPTELLDWRGPVLLCRFTFRVDGFYQPAEVHNLGIQVRRGTRLAVQESFDADDLDAARSRFRELVRAHARAGTAPSGVPDVTNRATELFAEAHRRFVARDPERWRAVFADDFVATSRERLAPDTAPLGPDEYVRIVDELRAGVARDAESHADYDVLAVRGDHHCVVRLTMMLEGYDVSKLFVVETDDELLRQYVFFDPDALHDALDLLDELWSPDGMDPRHGQIESRYRRTFASGTADDFRALATDDFEFRDHRKLGLGVRDLDEYLATSSDFFGCSEMIITEVLDWSGPVVLLRATFRLPGDDQVAEPHLLTVTVSRGDRLAVQEPFDPDDLDAARARFDELVAEHAESPAPASGRGSAEVIAARAAAIWTELAGEINQSLRDRTTLFAFRDRFHPDFVGRWSSTLFAALDDAGRDEFLEVTAKVIDMGQRLELAIADVRNARLALGAYTISTEDSVSERLIVMRLDDGRLREFVVFDRADEDAARAELDRQWSAMHDTAGVRLLDEFAAAWNVGDLDRARSTMSDDVEIWSYRSVVTPGHTTGDQALAALFAFHEFLPRWSHAALDVRGDDLTLAAVRLYDDTGTEVEMLAVFELGADGLNRRNATFDPVDIDGASALLDAWHAARAPGEATDR